MHKPLFSERKPSINRVKITLELTKKLTKFNRGLQRLSVETDTLTEFR